jgi:FkbM family methyltransferase
MLFTGPYIGKCFDLYGEYSESEVELMRHFLRPGDTVIDVGANIGDLTVPIAGLVGETGQVYAIESNPEMFNVLCANLALNGIHNSRPINAFVATSDNVDTAGPWGEHAFTGTRWQPTFITLDNLKLQTCQFIKVDVDGKELEVLKSGRDLVARTRPVLYFENDQKSASNALLAYVMGLDYDLYWHTAPIYSPNNYFGNPENHWALNNVVSLMVVGIPRERHLKISGLRSVQASDEWWTP